MFIKPISVSNNQYIGSQNHSKRIYNSPMSAIASFGCTFGKANPVAVDFYPVIERIAIKLAKGEEKLSQEDMTQLQIVHQYCKDRLKSFKRSSHSAASRFLSRFRNIPAINTPYKISSGYKREIVLDAQGNLALFDQNPNDEKLHAPRMLVCKNGDLKHNCQYSISTYAKDIFDNDIIGESIYFYSGHGPSHSNIVYYLNRDEKSLVLRFRRNSSIASITHSDETAVHDYEFEKDGKTLNAESSKSWSKSVK